MGTSVARGVCLLRTTCDRAVSVVFKTALNGSVNWPWCMERAMRVKRWEAQTLRLPFRPRMKAREEWVEYRKRTSRPMRAKWREMNLPTMAWVTHDGDVPVLKARRSMLRWRTTTWWQHRSAWGTRVDLVNVSKWKHKCVFSQQGRGLECSYGEVGWRGERLVGTRSDEEPTQERSGDCCNLEVAKTACETPAEKGHRSTQQKKNKGTGSYGS